MRRVRGCVNARCHQYEHEHDHVKTTVESYYCMSNSDYRLVKIGYRKIERGKAAREAAIKAHAIKLLSSPPIFRASHEMM
jgi:hypothetical protein